MEIRKVFAIFALMNFACTGVPSTAMDEGFRTHSTADDCTTLTFRYLEIYNWMKSPKMREIDVFLDPEAFSPETLRLLFARLSEKYPEPNYLTIKVKTDWSQLAFPSDCPPSGSEGDDLNPPKFENHRATYFRRGEDVYFYFTTELKTEKMEKVVISGTRQPRQRWEPN